MLDKVILENAVGNTETKDAVKPASDELGAKLSVLQQKLKQEKVPVIILIDGWGAAGKGSLVGKTILNFDPRGINVVTTNEETQEEKRKPFLHKFWMQIPAKGEVAIFDKSWYSRYTKKHREEINIFERQLSDDGYLIIKIFLHITKKEQKKRLDKLLSKKSTKWRVTAKDIKENDNYYSRLKKYDQMLEDTNTSYAKWNVISSMDKNVALYSMLGILVSEIESRLNNINENTQNNTGILPEQMKVPLVKMPLIEDIKLDCDFDEAGYNEKLDCLQKKLGKLSYKLYKKGVPLIIGYEGWDAAGKGGNIKRVVSGLDPRDYSVTPVAAPDFYEINRHYLWRFQKNIPKSGHIQIFDRTWYGRVMVERIEGFCTKEEYLRAYNEINEFEKSLVDWGAIVIKFWLQIDKAEQLRRFEERQRIKEKNWKITDEDWRNREKWDEYQIAVNDMIKYTSTQYAPWNIIESNNKHYARIRTLDIIINEIEEKLKRR